MKHMPWDPFFRATGTAYESSTNQLNNQAFEEARVENAGQIRPASRDVVGKRSTHTSSSNTSGPGVASSPQSD
jgi:hypothetical protein